MKNEQSNKWKQAGLLIVLAGIATGLFWQLPSRSATEGDVVAARYHLRSRSSNFYARSKPGYSSSAKKRPEGAARKYRG